MIVGSFFVGDDDVQIARKQHDVYHQALGILVEISNRYARFAKSLLGDTGHREWGEIVSCDHRTLQSAHDLLAAAWRYRTAFLQPSLALNCGPTLASTETAWLAWLRAEALDWICLPSLVRSVQLILINQNEPTGYAAEARLCLGILDRFSDMPWHRGLKAAYEADIGKVAGHGEQHPDTKADAS